MDSASTPKSCDGHCTHVRMRRPRAFRAAALAMLLAIGVLSGLALFAMVSGFGGSVIVR